MDLRPAEWMAVPMVVQRFEPYGPSHRVVLVVAALGAAALVVLGRRLREPSAPHQAGPVGQAGPVSAAGRSGLTQWQFSRGFAVLFGVILVPLEVYWLLPAHFTLDFSLPLQLCDLAAFAAVWALWSQSSVAFALTYYWGLTLTAQAFLSPEVNGPDFPSLEFLMFFAMHTLVVWAAIYLTWGVGMRPDWRSYRLTLAVTLGWGAAMFVLNGWAGTNYGFLNAKPRTASLFDLLGPWPWYLLGALALGAAGWAAITWPWVRSGGTRHSPAVSGAGKDA